MASFYDRYVLPRVIRCGCGASAIRDKRAALIPQAQGRVLEIGCGGGLNFPFYDPARVTAVLGIDPSPELLAMARTAGRTSPLPIEVVDGAAEALSAASATFDTVVLTMTLCSVGDPARALAEMRRVLKPGGRLLFCEHGLAPDAAIRRWQRRIEPVWKRLAGGCHLTRPIGKLIGAAGFEIASGGHGYLRHAPRFAGWMEWGVAL